MAGRGPQSFKKRQKEQQRKEKQAEKAAKRLERRRLGPAPLETDDQLIAEAKAGLAAGREALLKIDAEAEAEHERY